MLLVPRHQMHISAGPNIGHHPFAVEFAFEDPIGIGEVVVGELGQHGILPIRHGDPLGGLPLILG